MNKPKPKKVPVTTYLYDGGKSGESEVMAVVITGKERTRIRKINKLADIILKAFPKGTIQCTVGIGGKK